MEKQYIKGFNYGFLIAKYEPKLMSSITMTLTPKNTYLEGMINGNLEFQFEHTHEQLREVENLRNNSNDRRVDLNR